MRWSVLFLATLACSNTTKPEVVPTDVAPLPDADTDADTDTDTDTDTDADADTDADTDTATDTDNDTGPVRNDTGAAGFSVVLNEVLADPGSFDANCDGLVDAGADEFVEVVNAGSLPVDLTGATLSDATSVRHTFATLVLQPT